MYSLYNIFEASTYEKNLLKTSGNKVLVNAIKNRHPVTFIYKGPDVKAGKRFKVEFVALGLSKRGNLIVRGYVQPPSVSKTGYNKLGWRTFMVSRMFDINLHEDETFDIKRPEYKEGNDGSMTVTYVTSTWGKSSEPQTQPRPEPQTQPQAQPRPEPQTQPEPTDTTEPPSSDLPQPQQKEKPTVIPQTAKSTANDNDSYRELERKSQEIGNQKQVQRTDYDTAVNNLLKKKIQDWNSAQKGSGGSVMPGQGTRLRLKKEAESELQKLMKQNNLMMSDNTNTQLQESLKRIKKLMM